MCISARFRDFVIGGAFLLGFVATAPGQDAFTPDQARPTEPSIKITECVVFSVRDHSIQQDCTAVAAKLCDGLHKCELPIGLSLTGGRDIDPVGTPSTRRMTKAVNVVYQCGGSSQKRGPNLQDENATLTLRCSSGGVR